MKKTLLALALLSMTGASLADCYILRDKQGAVLSANTKPPFDISTNPDSPALVASRRKGETLQITKTRCSRSTPTTTTQRNEEIMARLADSYNPVILTLVRKQQEEEEYYNQLEELHNDTVHELRRWQRGAVDRLRFYNDIMGN